MENLRKLFNEELKKKKKLSLPFPPAPSPVNSSENFKPSGKRIKVYVICPNARIMTFNADIKKRVKDIKNEVLIEITKTIATNEVHLYRLIKAEYAGTELNETSTLDELAIKECDSLMLVPRRNLLSKFSYLHDIFKAPTQVDIDHATANEPLRMINKPIYDVIEIFQQTDINYDIRKVFISLAQKAAIIIGSGPYAQRVIEILKYRIKNKQQNRKDILKCFTDLGFNKDRVQYALKMHNGLYQPTFEWLVRRQSEDLSFAENLMNAQKFNSLLSLTDIFSNNTIVENMRTLQELVRIHCYCQSPPSEETVNKLTDMGFDESEVIEALKRTCNNLPAASEWLCGLRNDSLMELTEGLSKDSKIFKDILKLSRVQMHLSNPKVLLVFLSIIENEHAMRQWGGDEETFNVLSIVFQKYHEEKHNLGINQYTRNRLDM